MPKRDCILRVAGVVPSADFRSFGLLTFLRTDIPVWPASG